MRMGRLIMTDTKKNIFIEGMQGSGKTTLLTKIIKKMPEYRAFEEGDISPVELAWCSYMPENKFQEILQHYPQLREEILKKTVKENESYITAYTQISTNDRNFYEEMESNEIYNGRVKFDVFRDIIYKRYEALATNGNIFECSFFQNSIESMMLFYEMSDEAIFEFYKEAYNILAQKNFKLLYLDSEQIRENLLQIRKERCDDEGKEIWYSLMLSYLSHSPYGITHNYSNMDDMISHFERRRELELSIIKKILGGDAIVLQSKKYLDEDLFSLIDADLHRVQKHFERKI